MKVCMMVSNDVLSDVRVIRHAKSLGKHGHDVAVIGVKTERTGSMEVADHFRIVRVRIETYEKIQNLLDRVKIHHRLVREKRIAQSPFSSQPSSVIRRFVRRFSDISMLMIRLFDMNLRMAKIARKLHADVYTSNDLDTLLAGVIASLGGGGLIYDSHEIWIDMFIGMPSYLRAFFYILERSLIRRAKIVITVNEFIAKKLAERYRIDTPNVVLNCVEAPEFLQVKHDKRDKKIVLYHGVYGHGRGLENLVLSCEYFEDDVVLLMRGFGGMEPELRELAKKFSNCMFADPVPITDVVEKAAEADVGVIPYLPLNLGNYFSSPNKLFEYIQAGLPVVTSDLPFLRKVVLGEQIGLICDPRDPKSIARAVNAITREDTLTQLRENVRKAAGKYHYGNEEKKILGLYEIAVTSGKR